MMAKTKGSPDDAASLDRELFRMMQQGQRQRERRYSPNVRAYRQFVPAKAAKETQKVAQNGIRM
jgi:ribosomal protein L44E